MDRLIIENGGTHMKPTKILLIVAAGLSAVGLVIAGIGFSLGGFDFRNLTTRKTGTDKSQSFPLENVSEIYIDVRDQPVVIEHSPDDKLHILYREDEGDRYTIESDNGRVSFLHRDNLLSGLDSLFRGLFYSFMFDSRTVTVQLPAAYAAILDITTTNASVKAADYSSLKAAKFHTSNAPVTLSGIVCTDLDISTSNAPINLKDITAASAALSSSNGRLSLENMQIDGELTARTSNAALTLKAVACRSATLETSNGEMQLTTVKAAKNLTARSSNAAVRLESLESPIISLKTSNASVRGTVTGDPRLYYLRGRTSNGSNNLAESGDSSSANRLEVTTSNGDIQVTFTA